MKSWWSRALLLMLVLAWGSAVEAAPSFLVDGVPSEWESVRPMRVDSEGDGGVDGLDFDTLAATIEGRWLLIRLNTGKEISLANGSDVELLLDLDGDEQTGFSSGGLGADLHYRFGDRRGSLVSPEGEEYVVKHHDIGLVTAPTVTASRFELALPLDAMVAGQPLFAGERLRLAFRANSINGDRVPDEGGLEIALRRPEAEQAALPDLSRSEDALRIVSWNVLHDGLLKRPAAFAPLLTAMDPDVILFEEAWDATPEQVKPLLDRSVPVPGGWHLAKHDILIASRFPLLGSWPVEKARAGAFLVNAGEAHGGPWLVVGAHLPCCAKDRERQLEIDAIHATLRDARSDSGSFAIDKGTPIVIGGDMNLVGEASQLASLRTGTIVNVDRFGESVWPDWDGSSLTDLALRHPSAPFVYTWYDTGSSYPPGELDYIFYTDSVLEPVRAYVLHTPLLSDELLSAMNLNREASTVASDHAPVVVDFIRRDK